MRFSKFLVHIVWAFLLAMPAAAKEGIYAMGISKCITADNRMLNCGEEAVCNNALMTCSYAGVAGKFFSGHTNGNMLELKTKQRDAGGLNRPYKN